MIINDEKRLQNDETRCIMMSQEQKTTANVIKRRRETYESRNYHYVDKQ